MWEDVGSDDDPFMMDSGEQSENSIGGSANFELSETPTQNVRSDRTACFETLSNNGSQDMFCLQESRGSERLEGVSEPAKQEPSKKTRLLAQSLTGYTQKQTLDETFSEAKSKPLRLLNYPAGQLSQTVNTKSDAGHLSFAFGNSSTLEPEAHGDSDDQFAVIDSPKTEDPVKNRILSFVEISNQDAEKDPFELESPKVESRPQRILSFKGSVPENTGTNPPKQRLLSLVPSEHPEKMHNTSYGKAESSSPEQDPFEIEPVKEKNAAKDRILSFVAASNTENDSTPETVLSNAPKQRLLSFSPSSAPKNETFINSTLEQDTFETGSPKEKNTTKNRILSFVESSESEVRNPPIKREIVSKESATRQLPLTFVDTEIVTAPKETPEEPVNNDRKQRDRILDFLQPTNNNEEEIARETDEEEINQSEPKEQLNIEVTESEASGEEEIPPLNIDDTEMFDDDFIEDSPVAKKSPVREIANVEAKVPAPAGKQQPVRNSRQQIPVQKRKQVQVAKIPEPQERPKLPKKGLYGDLPPPKIKRKAPEEPKPPEPRKKPERLPLSKMLGFKVKPKPQASEETEKIEFDDDFVIDSPHGMKLPDNTVKTKPIEFSEIRRPRATELFEDDFVDSERSDGFMITQTTNVIGHDSSSKSSISKDWEIIDSRKSRAPPPKPLHDRLPKDLPFSIKDKITRQAIDNVGLKVEDLYYPSETDLNTYTRDPELREEVRKRLCRNVDELVAEVQAEIENIRREAESRTKQNKIAQNDTTKNFDEKAALRQKKEVETLLLQLLRKKHLLEEQRRQELLEQERKNAEEEEKKARQREAREKRKRFQEELERKEREREQQILDLQRAEAEKAAIQQKRLQEIQEQKRKEAKQKEAERKQKMEAVKKQQEDLENKRIQEANEKQQAMEAKEQERMQRFEEERNQIKQERMLERLRKQQIRQEMRRRELLKRRKIMRESEERQKRIDEAIRMLEEQKQAKQIFLKMEEKRKQDQARKLREEAEERRRQLEEDIKARQEQAEAMLRVQEKEKERKAMEAKLGYSETSQKMQQKRKQQEQADAEKLRKLEEDQKRKEERFAEVQKEMTRERTKQMLEEQVKRQQRQFEATRKARKDALAKERMRVELEDRTKELEEMEKRRSKAMADMKKQRHIVDTDKKRMTDELAMSLTDDVLENALLRKLAEKYGIDIDLLEERAFNAYAGLYTESETDNNC